MNIYKRGIPMQPSLPNVPEIKQMDLFEKQDIPYTPPPVVKNPPGLVESREITNLHVLICSHCIIVFLWFVLELSSATLRNNKKIQALIKQLECVHTNTTIQKTFAHLENTVESAGVNVDMQKCEAEQKDEVVRDVQGPC